MTKDMVIEGFADELNVKMGQLGRSTDTDIISAARHIQMLLEETNNNPECAVGVLSEQSIENLNKITALASGTNNDLKWESLVKVVFSNDEMARKRKEADLKVLKDAMVLAVKITIYTKFSSEKGSMRWSGEEAGNLSTVITGIIAAKARADGVTEGRRQAAEAAAKAAPKAAAGGHADMD